MYFNVSQLLKESSGSIRRYEIDEELPQNKALPIGRVAGTLTFIRTDKGIWVEAELDTSVSCECSRCLEPCEQAVHLSIEEEYFPVLDILTGVNLVGSGEPEDSFYIDSNHILDMTEALRQYAEMGTPLKPVCSYECRGICANCGTNLNEMSCDCDNSLIDSRWGPLLEFVSVKDNYN